MSVSTVTPTTGTRLKCFVCDVPLPLRLARPGEQGQDWACRGCGSTMVAVFDELAPAELRKRAQAVSDSSGSTPTTAAARQARVAQSQLRLNDYVPRGTAAVSLPSREAIEVRLQTAQSSKIDASVNTGHGLIVAEQGTPFALSMASPGAVPYDETLVADMVEAFDDTAEQLHEMFQSLEYGRSEQVSELPLAAERCLTKAAEDLDLFVALGLNSPEAGYPQRHSLHAGMMAMAIGSQLGYDQATLVELGLGCLIHDVGMLKLEDRQFTKRKILASAEFAVIARHPIYTLDLLADHLELLPASSRMVAYQIHERCNGSGYPRGREAASIHQLAKIAAVADVFVALVSPRPHRAGLLPYHAMEQMIRGAAEGLYDREIVRGLLKTVSLFPLGSFVALSDGRVGKVLRSNGVTYDRPIVQILKNQGRSAVGDVIDLSQAGELKVVRALPRP